jgi:hypothetical protein
MRRRSVDSSSSHREVKMSLVIGDRGPRRRDGGDPASVLKREALDSTESCSSAPISSSTMRR